MDRPRRRRFDFLLCITAALAGIGLLIGMVDRNSPAVSDGEEQLSGPVAAVDPARIDLGSIETAEEFRHTFVIRNGGVSELRLTPGPQTCRCLVADIPSEPIVPGGQAEVRVVPSEAAKKDELPPGGTIDRGIRILTNDPRHELITLVISAKVRSRLAASPAAVTLNILAAEMSAEQKRSAQTVVYSQSWDRFDLSESKSSLPGMRCRIEPAAPDALTSLAGRSGYMVSATLPPDMKDGVFQEWIELSAKASHPAGQTATLRLKLDGQVSGRVTFHGAKMVDRARLQMGTVRQGESARETILMKVNDARRAIAVTHIETKPEFLHARVAPLAKGSDKKGLYQLSIELPTDASAGVYSGGNSAVVRLRTDHPLLPLIELKVDVVVFSDNQRPQKEGLVAR
jgi:hypothetical protein